jgi:NADH-quinone oxidoreductase subunit K
MTVPLSHYLAVGAALFVLGAVGFLTRRNLIVLFLSAEMMLQGVTLNLVAFSRDRGNLHGQVFALFIVTVAACEAGVALALIVTLYRARRSLDVSLWQDLRESGQEPTVDTQPLPPPPEGVPMPTLSPTGLQPADHRPEDSYV